LIQIVTGFEPIYQAAGVDISQAIEVDLNDFFNEWKMPEKAYKIRISTMAIPEHILNDTDLGQLLIGLKADFKEQTFIKPDFTDIYVANVLPQYQAIFDDYAAILQIIENPNLVIS